MKDDSRQKRSHPAPLVRHVLAISVTAGVIGGSALVGAVSGHDTPQTFAAAQTQEVAMDAKAETVSLPLRSLLSARDWINTPPLRSEDLRGKVVLVNFWTYSCINSLRPLPYLRAWADKYRDRGLVVIGVHSPEFAFEHDLAKVRTAAVELPVGYPVVVDNDYEIWRAFNNQAWPGFYFFDARGQLRNRVLGEGRYDLSEEWIQKLLAETNRAPVSDSVKGIVGEGAQAPPDWDQLRSPETYVGFARATSFSSPGGVRQGVSKAYASAKRLAPNHWSLFGTWTIGAEFAELDQAAGRISFRFHARDLHMVLGKKNRDGAIPFRVTLEGKPPGANHGVDIDAEGWGSLEQDRMYQLVRQTGVVDDRTFEIEFLQPGARAYSFTFG